MSEKSPVLETEAQTTDDPRCIPIALDAPIEEGDVITTLTVRLEPRFR